MAKLVVIYWRDIPSQVIVKAGRKSAKVMLSERFQVAIDRAAMRAGAGTSDAYMADWERKEEPVEGDINEIANQKAAELEDQFSEDKLEKLTKAKGLLADTDQD